LSLIDDVLVDGEAAQVEDVDVASLGAELVKSTSFVSSPLTVRSDKLEGFPLGNFPGSANICK